MFKKLFPISTLNWCVNNCVSRQRKGINGRNESTTINKKLVAFLVLYSSFPLLTVCNSLKPFPSKMRISLTCKKNKTTIQCSRLTSSSFRNMATLRNKRKLSAASRETPENTRNNQLQNTLVPGMVEEYITQFSGEIEGMVNENFPKSLARRSHAFWVLCLNSMKLFWTHKFRLVP